MTEGHGDDIYKYGKENIKYNFSSNVVSPPKEIIEGLHAHIIENIGMIHSYPDPTCRELEARIAGIEGITPANVCVTNGATEAIYLSAMMLGGGETYIAEPTFREYRDACSLYGHNIVSELSESVESVWICNPNNPTGEVMSIDRIKRLWEEFRDSIVVLDQSYGHFTKHSLVSSSEGCEYNNLIMVHSLTKHFAVPGLRIGYITAEENIISRLKKLRMPWSVNSIAQTAGVYLLSRKFPDGWFENILKDAEELRTNLSAIGIRTYPTATHFILCETPILTSARLKEWLIDNKGILIRDASNFEGLTERHFRIASQGKMADGVLCDAISQWLNNNGYGK